MRERAAQEVVLARAFEEADPQGLLLRSADRGTATEEARIGGGSGEKQAECRAGILVAILDEELPGLARARRMTRIPRVLIPVVGLFALGLGIATNELGPERHLNLLAFPLLGLLAWNLGVYVVGFAFLLHGLRRVITAAAEAVEPPGRAAKTRSFFAWLREWAFARVGAPDPDRAAIVSKGLAAYGRAWAAAAQPLHRVRLRCALHLGAALLAVGVVFGMYLRGLSLAYEVTWESTFLRPSMVADLLEVVLGPAAAILSFALPDAVTLEAMRGPGGGVPAGPWIHLWALTAGAVIVVPRLFLAIFAAVVALRRGRFVPIQPLAGSFRVLLPADRGHGQRVEILPYSYALPDREEAAAVELAHQVVGRAVTTNKHSVLGYGAGEFPVGGPDLPDCFLVVFSAVQTPEREVHGRFLSDLLAAAQGTRILVVVDRSPWRLRFDTTEDARARERQRAWDRVIRETGLTGLHLDLGTEIRPENVALAGKTIDSGDETRFA